MRETKGESRALELPTSVAGPNDVGRLIRELEQIDEALLQLGLRSSGADQAKMPKTSGLMEQIIELNKLNLLQNPHRVVLGRFLNVVRTNSPVMHMSFSADPSAHFMEQLVSWLRREIHPLVLVTVGLQPNIGAGCILRTTNKQFDFSLRQDFAKKRDLLLKQLAMPPLEPVAAPAAAPAQEKAS